MLSVPDTFLSHLSLRRLIMRYADFQKLIYDMVACATASARRAFALDTIGRLHAGAQSAISDEFTESERLLLAEIVAGVERLPAAELKRKVRELNDRQCQDPVRAIEFNPKATDFICALDSWADYRLTNDLRHVVQIAISMVNAIDYDIEGFAAGYSIDNMLGAPEMAAEHRRQRRMLIGAE